jgi:hypothetical protein
MSKLETCIYQENGIIHVNHPGNDWADGTIDVKKLGKELSKIENIYTAYGFVAFGLAGISMATFGVGSILVVKEFIDKRTINFLMGFVVLGGTTIYGLMAKTTADEHFRIGEDLEQLEYFLDSQKMQQEETRRFLGKKDI